MDTNEKDVFLHKQTLDQREDQSKPDCTCHKNVTFRPAEPRESLCLCQARFRPRRARRATVRRVSQSPDRAGAAMFRCCALCQPIKALENSRQIFLAMPMPLSLTLRTISVALPIAISLISRAQANISRVIEQIVECFLNRTRSAQTVGKSGGTSTMTVSCLVASFFSNREPLPRISSTDRRCPIANSICRFQLRKRKQVGQQVEAFRMALHHSENSRRILARRFRVVEQCLDITAQDRQWRAQFVRDICDKIPPDLIHLLQLGDVVKQNECSGDFAPSFLVATAWVRFANRQGQLAANWATMIEHH